MTDMDKENKMKYKILALFGESGTGKDTIQKWIVSNLSNTKGLVSCTTRPQRDYEVDGVDYHFLEADVFANKIIDGSMLEATTFNNWFYGTPIEALDKDKINVGVFNIQGIECLLDDSRLDVIPVYVWAPPKERLIRALDREKNPNCTEVCRRFLADEKDFDYIPFEDECIFFLNDGEHISTDLGKQDMVRHILGEFDKI